MFGCGCPIYARLEIRDPVTKDILFQHNGSLKGITEKEAARAYRAACTPDCFLFDAGRKLVYRGQLDGSRPKNDVPVTGSDLRAAIDAVLAGRAVNSAQRPSIGCNIKWKPGNDPGY